MPKNSKLFCFLVLNCTLLLFLSLFLIPKESLGQSGRVKSPSKDSVQTNKPLFSLSAKDFLRIENPLGNITIEPTQSESILVQATRRNSPDKVNREDLIVKEEFSQVQLQTLASKNSTIDLKIQVPTGTNLRLLSETGNINVSFVTGTLLAKTKTGNINLTVDENINADISISSTFGTIKTGRFTKTSDTNQKSFYKSFGSGGSIVTLHSEQGNISLETSNVVPTQEVAINKTSTAAATINKAAEPSLSNYPTIAKPGKRPELRRNEANENTSYPNNSNDSTSYNDSNNSNSSGDDDGVIKIESQLVTLNAAALTASGQPVINLDKSDFLLYEDGVTQEIIHFQSVNTPFNLVLLIDLSGSVKEKLKLIQRSAWAFVQATRPEDKVAIIAFAGSTQLVCPLTNDRQLLKRKIEDIRDAGGGTNFYDAVINSINSVLDQVKNQRNAIVIMSDGVDNSLPGVPGRGSQISFNDLLDKIQESDTIIFPIFLNTEEEVIETGLYIPQAYAIARQQLLSMAETTGGSIFYANQLSDLTGCYEKVAAELRTIYSLGYYPSNGNNDGSFRKIRVRVKKDDVKVKTRRGYYSKNA